MFAPLHILSSYSLLKSSITMDKIKASVEANHFYGAGLCDFQVLYGVPDFVKQLNLIQKKYLVGMSVKIAESNVCLYAISEEGYHHLIQISSVLQKEDFQYATLKSSHSGLIGIIETGSGKFKDLFLNGKKEEFTTYLSKINALFERFYLGLEIDEESDREYADKIRAFVKDYPYDIVAFPKVRYAKKQDAISVDILNAIENKTTLDIKEKSGSEYFKSEEELSHFYLKEELENTVKIMDLSSFDFNIKRGTILKYPVNDSILYLKQLVKDGLIAKNIYDEPHILRAKHELDIIVQMGYPDYFLVVQDYVNWAKNNDILLGPGRGSAPSSLVAYALNITEIDPLQYDLLFERFLNPDRKTMPDIDIDFIPEKRREVINYCKSKYGADHVSEIISFQTMGSRQSIRDIGKVYQFPDRHIDLLCKTIKGKDTLKQSYLNNPTFKNLVDQDPYFLEIVSLASKIEGLPRNVTTHASGVILSQEPLMNNLPMSYDSDGHLIDQFEFDYIEEQGFLKMDFLVLTNLDTIEYCCQLVNKRHPETTLDKWNIPYQDKNAIHLIASGFTMGIFQLESNGMKLAINKIKPTEFMDIATLLAIFRPGPMDEIDLYVARKKGEKKMTYPSNEIEKILAPTQGIMIYQEQVNLMAQYMAGFTPAEADIFRRAVSKKKYDVLASNEEKFIRGAMKKGYSEQTSKHTFELILKFADYGFNKAHAVVYSIIACRMAYLKYYYPLEFYSSILATSSSSHDEIKLNQYIAELKKRNLKIFKPDINRSLKTFAIVEDGLIFPLNGIKEISDDIASAIIGERENSGEFKSFFDFVSRLSPLKLKEKHLSALISSGAFDHLNPSRATLKASILPAIQYAELFFNDGQLMIDSSFAKEPIVEQEIDDPLSNLEAEYDVLGIMLSDNPMRYKKDLLMKYKVTDLISAKENLGRLMNIAGIIRSKKRISTKKNNALMAFLTIYDENDDIEVVVFPKLYESCYTILEKNNIVMAQGHTEYKDDKYSFIADKIRLLEE